MKRAMFVFASIFISLLASSNQYAKEPAKKAAAPKEIVPLITEVMTKEELQIYLKEKGIPVVTKENFKEPQLVWERTFDDPIGHIYAISDLTEKGNCIIITGRGGTPKRDRKLLFLDNKGNTRKEVVLGKIEENAFAVARGGKAAVVAKWNLKKDAVFITYYSEEGERVWSSDVKMLNLGKIIISDNGESIALQENNPEWSEEEWSAKDLNITKLIVLNSEGKQSYQFKNFRNIGWGEFSGDGKYYAGLFWWQKDRDVQGKLIYINAKEGKIQWEKQFGGNYWRWGEMFGEDRYLAISDYGNYVAAVDMVAAEKRSRGTNHFDYFEIGVFDLKGQKVSRIKDPWIYRIMENGLMLTGDRTSKAIADIIQPNFLIKPKDHTSKSEYRPDPRHPGLKSLQFVERSATIEDVNFKKFLIYSTSVHDGKGIAALKNFMGDVIVEQHRPMLTRFMLNGTYSLLFGKRDGKRLISIYKSPGGIYE